MADNPADLFDLRSDKLIQTLKRALTMLHERGEVYSKAIDALQKGQVAAVDSLVAQITSNFSALFTDASVVVAALQEGRYTSADITGPVLFSLQNGLSLSLDVSGPVGFSPAPVVMIGRKANTADKAVARVISWSKDTSTLLVDIVAPFGTAGPHTDCYVEVGLLSVLAESQILNLVQAMRDAVTEDRNAIAADKTTIAGYASTASSAAGAAVAAASAAVEAAQAAQTWDPGSYYDKTEADAHHSALAAGLEQAVTARLASEATVVTTDMEASAGARLLVDTSVGPIAIDLPTAPVAGNAATIWRDGAGLVTVNPNGNAIRNVSGELILDEDGQGVRLTFIGGEWIAFPETLS